MISPRSLRWRNARRSGWHVDAAYGGFFALTERGRMALRGIECADSVTLDPHKGMFLPYGTGCVLVRDQQALRRTHAVSGSYMPRMQTDEDLVDFCDLSPELSRDARGLRVWLPLKMHGRAPSAMRWTKKSIWRATRPTLSRAIPNVEIVAEPERSLLALRVTPPGLGGEEIDAFNRRLVQHVNAKQRAFCSPASSCVELRAADSQAALAIRICILSFRTHRDRIDACLEDLRASLLAM